MNESITISIVGKVQGVCFRYFTQAKARAYGLKGYVRNCRDGRVEVVATGEPAILNTFADEVKQGPPGSYVKECTISWLDNPGPFTEFSIVY